MYQGIWTQCHVFSTMFIMGTAFATPCLLSWLTNPLKIVSTFEGKNLLQYFLFLVLNPTALRTAKTLWSFGCSECNRVKERIFCNGRNYFPFKFDPYLKWNKRLI